MDLLGLKERLDQREFEYLSPLATPSMKGKRRRQEALTGHRQAFALDADRILHSRAYTRYIDKTQVFYLVKNDHITHRVLHVQLVSKIARTIGRFLGLNEDLIEAVALGHDIGHPPFGHDGERELNKLCQKHGLPAFLHNVQSVQFLDKIERNGKGWNLTLQTLDGILCHDGEVHNHFLQPARGKTFADFKEEIEKKSLDAEACLVPMTLEGCVVRFSDTIAYIGRDIEDAIELDLIHRSDIPDNCKRLLGDSNGTIVYRLVEDLITHSLENNNEVILERAERRTRDSIGFSPQISESLMELKKFNYERIYLNPKIKKGFDKIQRCYQALFENYLSHIEKSKTDSSIYKEFIDVMGPDYMKEHSAAELVRDFIAGMTDDYFLELAVMIGCDIPGKL